MKHKGIIGLIAGVLTVAVIVGAVLGMSYFTRVGYKSTGEHIIANVLPEKLGTVGFFKDGNIYFVKDGKTELIAENAYDAQSETPVYTADYAIDKKSGKMLYKSGDQLYLYNGNESILIASGVTSWRTAEGLEAIAFTTQWRGSDTLGTLFLYTGDQAVLIDTGVTPSTVRFSQDGKSLFAQKPNSYPEIYSRLYRYDLNGEKTLIDKAGYSVLWTNDDGSQLVTGEAADDSLYSYRLYAKNLKRVKNFYNVYYAQPTPDKSILYILHNYDYDLRKGTLSAVDMNTLREKKIAENVSFFNPDGVTNASDGVLYSVMDDGENALYSIYYGELYGKNTRIIRNTTEESLYTVAINSEKKSGYVLSYGASRSDGGVYYIKWNGNKLETERLASGFVDSLVYYELTDSVSFIKGVSDGTGTLYYLNARGEMQKIVDDCGAEYVSGNQTYTASAVLSNDGGSALYFTDIVTGNTTSDTAGVLKLYKDGKATVISEKASSAYMEAPVACDDFSELYYLSENDGILDLYYYNGTSTLIAQNVHGIIEIGE